VLVQSKVLVAEWFWSEKTIGGLQQISVRQETVT
jgi:hypothetical protein